jgi:hypothetical protein
MIKHDYVAVTNAENVLPPSQPCDGSHVKSLIDKFSAGRSSSRPSMRCGVHLLSSISQ